MSDQNFDDLTVDEAPATGQANQQVTTNSTGAGSVHPMDSNVETRHTAAVAPEQSPAEDSLPEKFKGKTASEIANSYVELEAQFGRKGSEIGELRNQVNQLMMTQFDSKQTAPTKEEEIDFQYEPEKAVRQLVAKETAELRQEAEAAKAQRSLESFTTKHPDYKEVGGSQEMIDWVKGSEYRMNLYAQANERGDLASADELLTSYKERVELMQTQREQTENTQKETLENLSSVPGAASQSAASSQSQRKVTFSRAKLRHLMRTNPNRYRAMDAEIQAAYREGRVI